MNKGLEEVFSIMQKYDMRHDLLHRQQVRHILGQVEDQNIIEQIGMADLPQIIDLLYYKYGGKYRLIDIGGDCMFRFGKTNVANSSYLPTFIHFISIEDNLLKIEGNVSWPTVLDKKFKFAVIKNGTRHECELHNANLDIANGKNTYETRKVFCYETSLDNNQKIEIKFNYECNGGDSISRKINAMRFCPVADCITGQYSIINGWIMYMVENALILEPSTDEKRLQMEIYFQGQLLKNDSQNGTWAVELRKRYFTILEEKKKPIWMFMDRPDRADDNAETFFKYMQGHNDVETVFVIDNKSKDYERIASIGKVVDLYSEDHYLTALLADYIVSSQCNGVVENPFWDKAEYFRDLYHRPKIIFLQHGVIKDDMSLTLNRFNTNFTGFITSTRDEYESILKYPYFYTEKEVWYTGLPIFDELESHPQKTILVMPTWRQGLMHQEWNKEKEIMEWIPNREIRESQYYHRYYSLLHNEKLLENCRKHGYKIAFKPHPLMEQFIKDIVDNEILELWDSDKSYKDALAEGSILLTDYSSVAFEFAYLRKPVIYYQFDEKTFFEEHTYRKGYFDYRKSGFGEVENQECMIVDRICRYIQNECQLSGKYRERIEHAYNQSKRNACQQIYSKMCAGGEKIEQS